MIAALSLAVFVALVWGREEIAQLIASVLSRFSK
jgi:hypothetical protein